MNREGGRAGRPALHYLTLVLLRLSLFIVVARGIAQKVLRLGDDGELFAGAGDGQLAFLAGRAFEQRPDLPQGEVGNGVVVDGEEIIAGLDVGDRWLAVEIGNADDGEPIPVFRVKDETDDIEVGEPDGAADVEVDGRVGVVEADAVVYQGFGAEQARCGVAGTLSEKSV